MGNYGAGVVSRHMTTPSSVPEYTEGTWLRLVLKSGEIVTGRVLAATTKVILLSQAGLPGSRRISQRDWATWEEVTA